VSSKPEAGQMVRGALAMFHRGRNRRRYQDTIQLLVAMGGGWWDADLTMAINNDNPQEMHHD
jgi:hypothetical protein